MDTAQSEFLSRVDNFYNCKFPAPKNPAENIKLGSIKNKATSTDLYLTEMVNALNYHIDQQLLAFILIPDEMKEYQEKYERWENLKRKRMPILIKIFKFLV